MPIPEERAELYSDIRRVIEKNTKKPKRGAGVLVVILVSVLSSLLTVSGFIWLTGGRIYIKEARIIYETREAGGLTLSDVYERGSKWTVAVTAVSQSAGFRSYGTGVVYTPDGYIITNQHVINGAETITVTDFSGREFPAALHAEDKNTDIAVLKTDAALEPALWSDSSAIAPGNVAAVIGNPLSSSFAGTFTAGIVSSAERTLQVGNYIMKLIQINVSVNSGNSGGPLLTSGGTVVGIVNAKMDRDGVEGIGFAIPGNTVRQVADELIKYKKVVHRATLGVTVRYYDAAAARYYGHDEGVFVTETVPGSAAEKAGILPGDRLVSIDGVKVENSASVVYLIQYMQIGSRVEIEIERDGETMKIPVTLTDATVTEK